MRSKSGGEWVRTDSVRGGQTDGDHVTGEKCWRTSPAIWLKSARDFRSSKIPMHTAAATRTIAPPAFRCTSRISSVGGSQKSIVSASGPDKYDANHKTKKTLTARRFINTNLAPEAALTQIHSVPESPESPQHISTHSSDCFRAGARTAGRRASHFPYAS